MKKIFNVKSKSEQEKREKNINKMMRQQKKLTLVLAVYQLKSLSALHSKHVYNKPFPKIK